MSKSEASDPPRGEAFIPIISILPTLYQKKAPTYFIDKVNCFIEQYYRVNLESLADDQLAVVQYIRENTQLGEDSKAKPCLTFEGF